MLPPLTFSIGGRTMFLSRLFITILQSCLRILFSTALSQFSAYIDRDPAEYGVIRITHTQHKA